jgi:hypothetical protein
MLIPIVLGMLLTVAVFAVGLPQVHMEIRLGEWALVIVTLLLVVVTFLLVAATWGLVRSADRTARSNCGPTLVSNLKELENTAQVTVWSQVSAFTTLARSLRSMWPRLLIAN